MSFVTLVGKQGDAVALSVMTKTDGDMYEVTSEVVSPNRSRLVGMVSGAYITSQMAVPLAPVLGAGSILQMVQAAIGSSMAFLARRSFGKVPAAQVEAIDGRIDPVRAAPYLVPANTSGQQVLQSSPDYVAGLGTGVQLGSAGTAGSLGLGTIALIGLALWLVLKK